MELLRKAAMFLYKKACILRLPFFRGKKIESDLTLLHPGERIECVKTDYYVKKIAMCLTVLIAGLFLGLIAKINAGRNAMVGEGGVLYRGSYDEGERQLKLEADNGEAKMDFSISLKPRTLTFEEAETLAETLLQKLEAIILSDNEDIRHITSNLKLEESYPGFPFEVSWESSREEIIDRSGRVWEVEMPVSVKLRSTLTYQEFSKTKEYTVTVVPICYTPEEQEYQEMLQCLLTSETDSRSEESLNLPAEWRGKAISWRLKSEDYSLLIWALTPVVVLLVYLSFDRDLKKALEKKHKEFSREYPDLVHKLALYVGAGMTIRGAFQKIGSDYAKRPQKDQKNRPGCEEVLHTCRELQTGVAEGAAYEHFGRRIGLREYIKLSTLLGQNLKRGNSTLMERLREEAEKSTEESLLRARKLGEEAGTRLLTPMMLMLAIVMIMIMVPAFGTI